MQIVFIEKWPRMKLHKTILFISVMLLIYGKAPGQESPAEGLRVALDIPPRVFSTPGVEYGLKSTSGNIVNYSYMFMRSYDICYRNQGKIELTQPRKSMIIGFYGFKPAQISAATQLFAPPADTVHRPYAHALIGDLLRQESGIFYDQGITSFKLTIVQLSRDTILKKMLTDQRLFEKNTLPYLFIIWKSNTASLPSKILSLSGITVDIDIKKPTESVSQDAGASGHVRTRQADSIDFKGLPIEFLPEVTTFVDKKKIPVSGNTFTYRLSEKNDMIFLIAHKGADSVSYPIPLKTKKYLVGINQSASCRIPGKPDPEVGIIWNKLRTKIQFSYRNYKLVYDGTSGILEIPECFPTDQVKVTGITIDRLVLQPRKNEADPIEQLLLDVRWPKFQCRIEVRDTVTNKEINTVRYFVVLNQGTEVSIKGFLCSGDTITGLYRDTDVRYRLHVVHPDYARHKPVNISALKETQTISIHLSRTPSFNFFYADLAGIDKSTVNNILKSKIVSLSSENSPFYLIVSNGPSPIQIRTLAEFKEFSRNLGKLEKQKPEPNLVNNTIRSALNIDSIPAGTTFHTHFFMSVSNYELYHKRIMDGINQYLNYLNIYPNQYYYLEEAVSTEGIEPDANYFILSEIKSCE
jgi:hypothetical protein